MSRWSPFTDGGNLLAVKLAESWFVIEQVDVRKTFGLEEAEHALGLAARK